MVLHLTLAWLFAAALPAAPAPAAQHETQRVSLGSLGNQAQFPCEAPAVSADGRFIAFVSNDTKLVPNDTNGYTDVFVRDTKRGLTVRVSVSAAGIQADGDSFAPSISADGRRVAFHSFARNLVHGDTNGYADVFVRDLPAHTIWRASVTHTGAQALTGDSIGGVISGDGSAVAFRSWAWDIASAPDLNGKADIFLWRESTGGADRVSIAFNGGDPNRESIGASVSHDGRFVAFFSIANNILPPPVDTNQAYDVFVRDTLLGVNLFASRDSLGAIGNADSSQPSLSADGRFVAFRSSANNLVPGDLNGVTDVFRRDLVSNSTVRVSLGNGAVEGDGSSSAPSLSADGRWVAFESAATNFGAVDVNGLRDIYLRDVHGGTTQLISVSTWGVQADQECADPAISGDSKHVAFRSPASTLVYGDSNMTMDVFLHTRGVAEPVLAVSGTCPGALTMTVTHATPQRWVAFLHGGAGSTTLTTSPCAGLLLDLDQPVVDAVLKADISGAASLFSPSNPGACGRTVQAVDVKTCRKTNSLVL